MKTRLGYSLYDRRTGRLVMLYQNTFTGLAVTATFATGTGFSHQISYYFSSRQAL